MDKLNAGEMFPSYQVDTVAHGRLTVPSDLKGKYSVVLFYRGWW